MYCLYSLIIYYLRQGGYVFLPWLGFQQDHSKSYGWIFIKFWKGVRLGIRNNRLELCHYLFPDPSFFHCLTLWNRGALAVSACQFSFVNDITPCTHLYKVVSFGAGLHCLGGFNCFCLTILTELYTWLKI